MSARSRRDNGPELQCSDVTRSSALTASNTSHNGATSGQELTAEVERLSEADDTFAITPSAKQAEVVVNAELQLADAAIRMCEAAVDAATASEVFAKRRELSKAKADKLLVKAKIEVNHCESNVCAAEHVLYLEVPGSCEKIEALRAASNARTALSEAKIGLLAAELEVIRATYLVKYLDSSKADVNASADVINRYRELVKAKAQLDVEKHEAAAQLEAEECKAAAELRIGRCKDGLGAARAAYRARNPHSAEADEDAFVDVRNIAAELEAEERKAAVELEAGKKLAAAKLAVEERTADLALTRAMYLFTHPGSSETDANASVEVCEAAFVVAEARFPTVDCTSKAEVGSVLQDVCKKLEALMEAKLRRDMPSADLKVVECTNAVSAAKRNHICTTCTSISLGTDPESKTAFPSDPATREDAAPEAESAVKPAPRSACPGLASCPQVWSTRRKLRMAEEERDMLRLQLEVEMRDTAFSAAKNACRLLYPNLANADVEASRYVSFYLHHLRKAEADRDVKKAQLHIASIADRLGLTRGNIRSPDPELSRAEVAKCEAIVAAARAVHRCANLGSTDAAANASPDVRLAVAELEVAKRQVAVDAARAALLSNNIGLSENYADASTDVVNMLQALHLASEDLRVLPAQIKLDACEAASSDASMKLLSMVPRSEGDVDTAFFEVMTTLKQRAAHS